MKLINVVVARSVWLFSLEELNPRGVRLNPTVALALEDHYDFQRQKRPEKPNELQFTGGAFTADGVEVNVNLQVYNDGMVAETSASTTKSDAFLHEVLTWTADQFGLNYHPGLVKKKLTLARL